MRAIILAAGVGARLGTHGDRPKCLLEFGGISLLERHLQNLAAAGIGDVALCTGYRHELLEQAVAGHAQPRVTTVTNPAFREGSVVSLWTMREALRAGDDVLLMDADVLYDPELLRLLAYAPVHNRFLCDRDFEPGDEPVKICLERGRVVEFRKQLAPNLAYDDAGESVGFFSLTAATAAALADITDVYVTADRRNEPYEEAIRDLVLVQAAAFDVVDVTGRPWVEIDFPEDIVRANEQILPRIQ
ncbi:MAG: phosphocholine cytidylyltransferase family protein [Gammaproteobacteria bacterium]|jgi:choline kinase